MEELLDLPNKLIAVFDSFPDIFKDFILILFTIGLIVTLIKLFR